MVTFGYELEEEFNAVTQFINDKYGIIIKAKEQLVNFTQKALTFMMTIKVWKKHLISYIHGTLFFSVILFVVIPLVGGCINKNSCS